MRIYDVTIPISNGMPVWPGDPHVLISSLSSIDDGDQFNVSQLSLGSHTGTHVDAPRHLLPEGASVDQLPLDALIGDAWVCSLPLVDRAITAADLELAGIPEGTSRLLLKTRNGSHWERSPQVFNPDFVALAEDGAQWAAGRGLRLVGIDYLSIDAHDSVAPAAHQLLLSRGVIIVEGLDLRAVPSGAYRLICLPIRITGADGAPARVVLLGDDQGD